MYGKGAIDEINRLIQSGNIGGKVGAGRLRKALTEISDTVKNWVA